MKEGPVVLKTEGLSFQKETDDPWIRIDVATPNQKGNYLIIVLLNDEQTLCIAGWEDGKWNSSWKGVNITHWMHPPKNPKKDSK